MAWEGGQKKRTNQLTPAAAAIICIERNKTASTGLGGAIYENHGVSPEEGT
jgi:hypothetical protein